MKALLVLFSSLFISMTALCDQLIFVINTTEEDQAGPVTAPYLDEARWSKEWSNVISAQKDGQKIRLIPIRANSNQEITKALELWMRPDNDNSHEVLGISIYSHGTKMTLLNESNKVLLQLPTDLATVFQPVIGRFAKGARVILTGCEVLEGQSEPTVYTSLRGMAQTLGLQSGMIYANVTKGFDPYTLLASPLNSDIKPKKRLAALATYVLWPFSSLGLPLASKVIFNKGYVLNLDDGKEKLLKVHQNQVFEAL